MTHKEWKKVTLKEILDGGIRNGFSPIPAEQCTGYWVLGLGALSDDGLNQNEIKPVEPTSKTLDSLLSSGDFLVSRSNTPDKVGRSVRFKGEIDNCSYPDLMMRFRINERVVDADFVEAFLKSSLVRDYYKSCAAGSSSTMVKINKAIVENTPLVLPPITEQQKIAKILSTWDQAIRATEKFLAINQQQKRVLMQQLLTGKRRFQDFTDEWKSIRLSSLLTEEKERNKGLAVKQVLSVTNKNGFVLPEDQFNRQVASDDLSNYKIVKREQFAYNPSRINVGSFARLDDFKMGVLSPMYVVFSIDKFSIDSDFFLNWMASHEATQRISSGTQGSVRNSVGFDTLCSFHIKLPSMEEQQKIAAVFTVAVSEIETLQQKLACLKQEKKSLMQQLLTGKRRVKVDES